MTQIHSSPFAEAMANYAGTRQAFKVAIVAPVHIQPSEAWVQALNVASRTATIIIVDDSDGKVRLPEQWDVFGYARQREELGDDLYAKFEQFHKSAACKQFGLWLAYKRGFDPIIVIDSDCVIPPDFVAKHIEQLLQYGDGWENPLAGTGFYSRGFPYHKRNVSTWAHMGLWENELDLYGTDRVGRTDIPRHPGVFDRRVATGAIPLSGMNVSFRNDAAPYMLFLPNFKHDGRDFTRHDDIWGGYIFQSLARMFGFGVSYGNPVVYHDTVVVPEEDAAEEEMMIKHEKQFYFEVDSALAASHSLLAPMEGEHLPPASVVFDELAKQFSTIADAERASPAPAGQEFPFEGLVSAFRLASEYLVELENRQ